MKQIFFLGLIMAMVGISSAIGLSSCQIINISGVYDLNSSVSGAPNNPSSLDSFDYYTTIGQPKACMDIATSNVTLNCHGFGIDNNGVPYSVGVFLESGSNNVSVNNCQIFGYQHGIYVYQSDNSTFANNTIENGGIGIDVDSSNGNNLTDDVIINNSQYGIFLQSSSNNSFSSDTAYTRGSFIFWAYKSSLEPENLPSIGDTVSNLNIGTSIVSFTSNDVNIRDGSIKPTITSGSPSLEIDVASTNQSELFDEEDLVMGISDGNSSHSRAITSMGPMRADIINVARQYAFDSSGNPVEFYVPLNITPIPNATAVPTFQDDGVGSPFPIGFNVSIFGRLVNTALVDGDGFLYLNQGNPGTTGDRCCSGAEDLSRVDTKSNSAGPDILISPDWDDLTLSPGENSPFYNATYGTIGTAPNRVFIIYFFNVSECCDRGFGNTFQVKLFENGSTATFGTTAMTDPPPYHSIGKHIEATDGGNDTANGIPSFLFLNVSYTPADLAVIDQRTLFIAKNNGSWITNTSLFSSSFGLNLANFYVFANITDFGSVFAPMGTGSAPLPSSSGGAGVSVPYMIISEAQVCPGNWINISVVTSNKRSAVAGATLTIYQGGNVVSSGATGSDGSVALVIPSAGYYTVKATSADYSDGSGGFGYQLCAAAAAPQCQTDSDCPDSQKCQNGQCVQLSCPKGETASSHQCQMAGCQSDSDCPTGQMCQNHACVNKPPVCTAPSCCTSNDQCADYQYCMASNGVPGTMSAPGTCMNVTGQCGYPSNHAFISYNYSCGSEAGCPQCSDGYSCISHQCVQADLTCPSTGVQQGSVSCTATTNGQTCTGCQYTVTAPNGTTMSGKTDDTGNFGIRLNNAGTYNVALVLNGSAIKQITITVSSKPAAPAPSVQSQSAGSDFGSLLWILVPAVIIIAAAFYWIRIKK